MTTQRRFSRLAAGLLLMASLGLGAVGCEKKALPQREPMAVRVGEVTTTKSDAAGARYSGSVKPLRQVDMAFKNGGYVVDLLHVNNGVGPTGDLQVGDYVKAGTTLATIRENDYTTKVEQARAQLQSATSGVVQARERVAQAEASVVVAEAQLKQAIAARVQAVAQVAEAKAGLKQARGQLDEARASNLQASNNYQRARKLLASDSITAPDYDSAHAGNDTSFAKVREGEAQVRSLEAKVVEAVAQVAVAEGRVRQAEGQVDVQKAALGEAKGALGSAIGNENNARAALAQAEITLGDCRLVVPMDSVVIAKNVERGTLANPGTVAFTLGDVRWIKVVFAVPDLEVNNLKVGQTLTIRLEALANKTFTGRISSISPAADSKSRVYDVEVSLANPGGRIRAGMIASLDVPGTTRTADVPVIPISAVSRSREHPEMYAVMIVEEKEGKTIARQREIDVGQAIGSNVVVKSGIKPGDRIIVNGAGMVTDGELVNVIK